MTYSFSENQWGEKFIEEINRADFVTEQSAAFLDKLLDFDLTADNTLFIVIGSDSGLILPYLSRQKLGRGSKVAVIEHDDVYTLVALEYRGLLEVKADPNAPFDHAISLHKFSTWQHEVLDASYDKWILGGYVTLLESHASATDYARVYTQIHKSVKLDVAQYNTNVSVSINRPIFTQTQFQNAIDNTSPLKPSLTFGSGKTAVVLGGGPTLDTHIEWVMANRSKLFVLAVSRICNKLILCDLKPDLLVSVDPTDLSYEASKHGLIWRDIPLVHNFHVAPRLLKYWQGPSFHMGPRFPWESENERNGNVPASGPTVGHAAIVVAWQLGFSTILTTGIDFCFSSTTASHASGSPEQLIRDLPSLCETMVETYSGRMAGAHVQLKNGLIQLEEIGKRINRDKPLLFNLALEAGRCDSIPWIDIEDVCLEVEKPVFSDHVSTEVSLTSLSELDALEKELKYARLQYSKIKTLCLSAKENISKIHDTNSCGNSRKYSRKLTKIRQTLETDYGDYIKAIIYDRNREFTLADKPMNFDQMSPEELIEWGCHYYQLLEKGTKTMVNYIDGMQPSIKLRREEHTGHTDVRSLMKCWREENIPGRILFWNRVCGHLVPPKDRAWVQRTIGKFRATLNQTGSNLQQALNPWKNGINGVLKSFIFLRENNHQKELEIISQKITSQEWPYSALKPFTLGLIDELQSDIPAALLKFQTCLDINIGLMEEDPEIVSKMYPLLEECLTRMTSGYIKLGDQQSALNTLGTLCEMVPTYVHSYCKMLHVCGQQDAAIELLQNYLQLYPTNRQARHTLEGFLQKGGQLPEQANNPDYANTINNAVQAIMGDTSGKAA